MNYTSLSPVCVPDGLKDRRGYEGEFVLQEAGSESLPILIPTDINYITVTLSFPEAPDVDASAYVQTTTDLVKKIRDADPDIVWVTWTGGEASNTTQDFVSPVSAIKLMQVDGPGKVKLTVRAQ